MTSPFDPIHVGRMDLPQRFVMAPLTRNRAGQGNAPTELNATYYGQRAKAGLIISEGTQPSQVGAGYLNTPGIHTDEQIAGWRTVADAVHADGGFLYIQLMHAGRIAHTDNKGGAETVAPSAVQIEGDMITAAGPKPHDVPRALETGELSSVRDEYVTAAKNAIAAGADGVEVHAANGYLLHQFLAPNTNVRTDAYGDSPAGRAKFPAEVVTAVAEAIGADRVGVRISPGHAFNGIEETDAADIAATYDAFLDEIAPLGLAYLSILADPAADATAELRTRFGGIVIANSGFASQTSLDDVANILNHNRGDLVAVGRNFLTTPDLVERWRNGLPLNEIDGDHIYGGGAEGYTDYPTQSELEDSEQASA